MISNEERGLINREMNVGESVIWADKPIFGSLFFRYFVIYIFAVPWTVFSLFLMFGVVKESIAVFLFTVPFVLVGLLMLLSPFLKKNEEKRTIYIVTNQRAIIYKYGRKIKVMSYLPYQLKNIERCQKKDGTGSIVFSSEISYDSDGDRQITKVGFIGIKDVKKVEDIIYRELLSSVKS